MNTFHNIFWFFHRDDIFYSTRYNRSKKEVDVEKDFLLVNYEWQSVNKLLERAFQFIERDVSRIERILKKWIFLSTPADFNFLICEKKCHFHVERF